MRSSTSSSDRSVGEGWLRTVVGGLLVAVLLLGAWECFWRASGFRPAIEDDLGIWAIKRSAVQAESGQVVALLGSSRMQLDVDPQLFQAETGYRTFMLAIDGNSPLPVLADLATNTSFNGIILCSLLPQWLADGGTGDNSRSEKWVRKFYKQKWSFWVETHLSLLLQSSFVFRYPGLQPDKLWEKLLEGQMPRPAYAPMRSDRYRPADYSRTDISRLRGARLRRQSEIVAVAKPLNEHEFAARISEIETMVEKIRQRGGSVIFLRLPSCDEIFGLEEEVWPRRKYWDRFTAEISARSLHFTSYPELSGFDCPDGSHLDYGDVEAFTRALIGVLDLPKVKNR